MGCVEVLGQHAIVDEDCGGLEIAGGTVDQSRRHHHQGCGATCVLWCVIGGDLADGGQRLGELGNGDAQMVDVVEFAKPYLDGFANSTTSTICASPLPSSPRRCPPSARSPPITHQSTQVAPQPW